MARETRLYELLGISASADGSAIKKAYRSNALKYHPDKNQQDAGAAEKFKEITRAYEILRDDDKRKIYDRYGEAGLNGEMVPNDESHRSRGGSMFMNPDDLFSQMFGDAFGSFNSRSFFNGGAGFSSKFAAAQPQQQQKRRGRDINYSLNCSLESLYTGKRSKLGLSKQLKCKKCEGRGAPAASIKQCQQCRGGGVEVLQRDNGFMRQRIQRTCTQCKGQGTVVAPKDRCSQCKGEGYYQTREVLTVDIPAGSRDQDKVVLKGKADEGPSTYPGDVIITVQEEPHMYFKREGTDLIHRVKIDLITALTGGSVQVRFFENKLLNVTLEQGKVISPGDLQVVKGHGMPYQDRDGATKYGDLVLKFDIIFPTAKELDANSISLLQQALPKAQSVPNVPTHKRKLEDDAAGDDEVVESGPEIQHVTAESYSNKKRKK